MTLSIVKQDGRRFISIPLQSVRVDSLLAFDLFIKRDRQDGSNGPAFVLYRQRDLPMRKSHVDRLLDSGVHTVFTSTADLKNYRRYLEGNLHAILTDAGVHMSQKAQVAYEAATGLIEDVWRHPNSPESIERSQTLVRETFTNVVDQKDPVRYFLSCMSGIYTTYTHSVNVCLYALALGRRLDLPLVDIQDLGLGALLHDIGKARIDRKILEKRGPLAHEEMGLVKQHPAWGLELLSKGPKLPEPVLLTVSQHHEKCDGSGYHQGLSAQSIHPFAKIACVADVFDALTSDRPYKRGVSAFQAFTIMRDQMAGSFERPIWEQLALMLSLEE